MLPVQRMGCKAILKGMPIVFWILAHKFCICQGNN
jgi:hypothetical protein